MKVSTVDALMDEIRRNLDPNGCIDRWLAKAIAKRYGYDNANWLYATSEPWMVKVPGTTLARPIG
jgi:hypothetical protein